MLSCVSRAVSSVCVSLWLRPVCTRVRVSAYRVCGIENACNFIVFENACNFIVFVIISLGTFCEHHCFNVVLLTN
jgi:hypothetical protein